MALFAAVRMADGSVPVLLSSSSCPDPGLAAHVLHTSLATMLSAPPVGVVQSVSVATLGGQLWPTFLLPVSSKALVAVGSRSEGLVDCQSAVSILHYTGMLLSEAGENPAVLDLSGLVVALEALIPCIASHRGLSEPHEFASSPLGDSGQQAAALMALSAAVLPESTPVSRAKRRTRGADFDFAGVNGLRFDQAASTPSWGAPPAGFRSIAARGAPVGPPSVLSEVAGKGAAPHEAVPPAAAVEPFASFGAVDAAAAPEAASLPSTPSTSDTSSPGFAAFGDPAAAALSPAQSAAPGAEFAAFGIPATEIAGSDPLPPPLVEIRGFAAPTFEVPAAAAGDGPPADVAAPILNVVAPSSEAPPAAHPVAAVDDFATFSPGGRLTPVPAAAAVAAAAAAAATAAAATAAELPAPLPPDPAPLLRLRAAMNEEMLCEATSSGTTRTQVVGTVTLAVQPWPGDSRRYRATLQGLQGASVQCAPLARPTARLLDAPPGADAAAPPHAPGAPARDFECSTPARPAGTEALESPFAALLRYKVKRNPAPPLRVACVSQPKGRGLALLSIEVTNARLPCCQTGPPPLTPVTAFRATHAPLLPPRLTWILSFLCRWLPILL